MWPRHRLWRRSTWRAGVLVFHGIVCFLLASQSLAQEPPYPVLTLDQDRFFLNSSFGRAAVERQLAATAALEQENERIEAELIAEELALTELRKTLPAEEFSARAEAFDQKVVRIRTEQDAKALVIVEEREKDRSAFLQLAVPVLGELMEEKKAIVIIDKDTAILSLSAIDVTDEAIARVDAAMADRAVPEP
jgi:Skp family chaperone for outer membrane proteins